MRYVKQSAWIELKKELFEDMPLCKLCGLHPATDLHHAVVGRIKKFNRILDVKENALEVCKACHKYADSYELRRKAFGINCERYGTEHMWTWYDGLPFKVKENF